MITFDAKIGLNEVERLIKIQRDIKSKLLEFSLLILHILVFFLILYAFNILAQSAYDFAFNNDFATADKLQTLSSIDYFWLKVAFVILVGLPLELWLIWKIGTSIRSIVDSSYLAKQVYKKNHSKFTLNTCIINEEGIEIKTPDAQSAFYSSGNSFLTLAMKCYFF